MSDLNYYDPLTTINDNEQNTLGKMQSAFNSALGTSNSSQDTMISSYLSTNTSRQACYAQCPQGWSNDTPNWEKGVKKDAADTDATPDEALKDVISSCKAGCDLKWPGIVQNAAGTQGVDGGLTVGRYTGTDGKKHDIEKCTDLSKFAPKVKIGGLCDANEECESDVCVNWGGKCARSGETLAGKDGRCGLSVVRIDGSNYAWGNTWNSMCKQNVEQYGLVKWPNYTQYFKYQGIWVKLSPDWGFPSAPKINNQRLENGQYIQDEATAVKAAEAYGDYCKGFYQQEGTTNFILQSAGGENPKPNWNQFASELSLLNDTRVEGFTSSEDENKTLIKNPTKAYAWGKVEVRDKGWSSSRTPLTAKMYNDPTFPIASTKAAMKKTCPKGWRSIRDGESCGIFNDDMRTSGGSGWNGSSFGCNLPNTDSHYSVDCEDVANEDFTCWVPSRATVPQGKAACKPIKGRDIGDCLSSGGRARKTRCPVAAKMVIWIGRPSSSYFATKSDIVSVMQQIATEFPNVRLTDQKEMDDIIAKNMANCAYGWYRTDVFSGTTWKTANSSWNGPGIENLPLTNGYPSNTSSGSGCGSGKQMLIGPGGSKGGIYITITATQEFVKAKLSGLGFTSRIVMSHQQMIAPVPPQTKQVWSLGSKGNSSIYVAPKPINAEGPDWRKVGGQLKQLSTGQKEVYGVNSGDAIFARAKDPGKRNATGGTEWRQIGGRLSNISASNKDYIFGVNKYDNIYQCKKPCTGGWQRISGGLKQVSGGQEYLYGVNSNDSIYRARLPITNPGNPQWSSIPGRLKWINATNKDYVYGTNRNDNIYACRKPCSGSWKNIHGGLDKIEADATKVYGVNSSSSIFSKPMDGMDAQGNWTYWSRGGGSTNVSPEPFVGGVKEGYSPLENDMIYQCKVAGTQGGESVPGVNPTGNFLVENRKKEKASFAKLQSMQTQVKKSINQLQGSNLQVNDLYKTKNTDLLKQLASYEQASHELLKSGANLDTLSAQQSDSLLRKNSIDMSYYLWLTLAISILGIAITKIK
uniref:Uncharacterized protein n=1 Tax=viral metagenome TaxID=1070528 RepID=A0A6C0EPN8_9ZZZZ